MVFTRSFYDILKVVETEFPSIGYEEVPGGSVVKRILSHPT